MLGLVVAALSPPVFPRLSPLLRPLRATVFALCVLGLFAHAAALARARSPWTSCRLRAALAAPFLLNVPMCLTAALATAPRAFLNLGEALLRAV